MLFALIFQKKVNEVDVDDIYVDLGGGGHMLLKEALDKNPDFSGKVNYAADIELTGDVLNFNNRKLVIDLNGHTLSCNRSRLLGVYFGSDITIQNGTIYAPRIHVPTRFYV